MGTNKEHAVRLAQWEALITSLAASAAELPELEAARIGLQQKMESIQALRVQHGQHQAAKQDALQKISNEIKEGRQIVAFLRAGVKHRFGKESEELIQFGVPPFRSKRRKRTVTPEAPAPSAGGERGTSPA